MKAEGQDFKHRKESPSDATELRKELLDELKSIGAERKAFEEKTKAFEESRLLEEELV